MCGDYSIHTVCGKIPQFIEVAEYTHNAWLLRDSREGFEIFDITHCPYCGVKLIRDD